ncbi:MAG: hypothetical protein NXI24_22565 [bacterium]|nr:hypothetical protein [bacterium]
MSYREIKITPEGGGVNSTLHIEMNPPTGMLPPGGEYDLDYFGQDDGAGTAGTIAKDAAFRLIFQLGWSYMIYVYVVGLAPPGHRRWFHTFWIKDCAVAEVDQEELGAPTSVATGPLSLPLLHTRVGIKAAAFAKEISPRPTRSSHSTPYLSDRLVSCEFSASPSPNPSEWNETLITIEWKLASGGMLAWNNREFWSYTSPVKTRYALEDGDRIRFVK